MVLQIARFLEADGTDIAFEGSFIAVNSMMVLQMRGCLEVN